MFYIDGEGGEFAKLINSGLHVASQTFLYMCVCVWKKNP